MLELRNLVKVYPGPVAALQGVSLEVPRGMFGLLGPNGAGKTTLMRIVAGLLEPTSGTVHFNGEDIVADPRRIRRQLGYLPQDFGFYPHLTGESMLRFLLVLKGVEAPARTEAPRGRTSRPGQPLPRCQAQGEGLLGRHAATPGNRAGAGGGPEASGGRRAHRGPRPRGAAPLLPPARRAGRRPHGAPLHAHRGRHLGAVSAGGDHVRRALRGRHDPFRGAGPSRGHDLPGRRGEG